MLPATRRGYIPVLLRSVAYNNMTSGLPSLAQKKPKNIYYK